MLRRLATGYVFPFGKVECMAYVLQWLEYVYSRGLDTIYFSVCLDENPIRYVMRTIWSTHLLNIATHESIYCLFPGSGVDQKVMFFTRFPEPEIVKLYQTYVDRGYRRGQAGQAAQLYEFSSERFVGDIFTRRVKFKVAPDDVPKTVRSVRFVVTTNAIGDTLSMKVLS